MTTLSNLIGSMNDIIWSYLLIIGLVASGILYSIRTRFVQLARIKEMMRLLVEGAGSNTGKDHITSFQAFCVSTASRVGVGNIAGIAIAVVLGGPGAIFWMWVIAILGSATGFMESTLAQIYKVPKGDGGFLGGPAYYIKNALGSSAMARLFAVLLAVTFGLIFNSLQANTIALSMKASFALDPIVTACVVTVLSAACVFGGLSRIARLVQWFVPVMAIGYILIALFVMITNLTALPAVFSMIFSTAFTADAALGGGLGAALMNGVKRGLFSNEAGMGSVPNAAATADVTHPVKQGLVQALAVFVDTLLVCSASAMIVLLCPNWASSGLTGIELVQHCLVTELGSWTLFALPVMIFMFAFSSIVGNYYYGEINMDFISDNRHALTVFRVLVVVMVFLGSLSEMTLLWNLADLFMGLLALTNLVAVALLAKHAYRALDDYFLQKKNGVEEPSFKAAILDSRKGVYYWD